MSKQQQPPLEKLKKVNITIPKKNLLEMEVTGRHWKQDPYSSCVTWEEAVLLGCERSMIALLFNANNGETQ